MHMQATNDEFGFSIHYFSLLRNTINKAAVYEIKFPPSRLVVVDLIVQSRKENNLDVVVVSLRMLFQVIDTLQTHECEHLDDNNIKQTRLANSVHQQ